MNYWTEKSFDLANNYDYLDRLYKIYCLAQNIRRNIEPNTLSQLKDIHTNPANFGRGELLNILLSLEIFPIKDAYVAYLRHDRGAISRNPNTVDRIEGAIFGMEFGKVIQEITRPIETNRQMGQLFRNWLASPLFRCDKTDNEDLFMSSDRLVLFVGNDNKKKQIAQNHFGYCLDKGIDFLVKNNNRVALGEAKFLTDFGGHQNAQFADAINIHNQDAFIASQYQVVPVSILDGVVYIDSKNNKMTSGIRDIDNNIVISCLLLQDFIGTL